MKIDVYSVNLAFENLIKNPDQEVFLDANFLIPPDRNSFGIKPFRFDIFKKIWLDPLIEEFSNLCIHESVYKELVDELIKAYVDKPSSVTKKNIKIHDNSELSDAELAMMNYYISKIAVHSKYDPSMDNSKDRGEVLSLSFMAVKGYLYFAANDSLPIRLIKEADRLDTGLDNMGVVQMYEIIYYLYKTGKYDKDSLRALYKYQYYMSPGDRKSNPEWGVFISKMDGLYNVTRAESK